MRIAQRTCQYQWSGPAFDDLLDFAAGEHVIFDEVQAGGLFFFGDEDPDTIDYTDPLLWQLPYNASPVEVGDGDVALEWVSAYPEMVLAIFNFQYCRQDHTAGAALDDFFVRSRIQLAFDDVRLPGAGVYAVPIDPTPRGLGLATRALRSTIVALQFLPAGYHRLSPVASQYPANACGANGDAFRVRDDTLSAHLDDVPNDNSVMIGQRKTIIMRCANAKELRS